MPLSPQEIKDARLFLDRSTYIRLALESDRVSLEPYTLSLTDLASTFELSQAEIFDQLANLCGARNFRSKLIKGSISSFTITWSEPQKLPSVTPQRVRELQQQRMLQQKGFLYFVLAAENPDKNATQQANPDQLSQTYSIDAGDIFGELSRMIAERAIVTDIQEISIQWLTPPAAPLPGGDAEIAAAFDEMRSQIKALATSVRTAPKAWGCIRESAGAAYLIAGENNGGVSRVGPGQYAIALSQPVEHYSVQVFAEGVSGYLKVRVSGRSSLGFTIEVRNESNAAVEPNYLNYSVWWTDPITPSAPAIEQQGEMIIVRHLTPGMGDEIYQGQGGSSSPFEDYRDYFQASGEGEIEIPSGLLDQAKPWISIVPTDEGSYARSFPLSSIQ